MSRRGATLQRVATMEFGIRDLRNDTGQVIDAVEAGNTVYITRRGKRVAELHPVGDDLTPVQRFVRMLDAMPAVDTGALDELFEAKQVERDAQERKERLLWG